MVQLAKADQDILDAGWQEQVNRCLASTKDPVKAEDPLDNLCWANRKTSYYAKKWKPGIHSWQYQKAVYNELKKAFERAGGVRANASEVAVVLKSKLQELGKRLEDGDIFW